MAEQLGPPRITLDPVDAGRLGLAEGELASVRSEAGELTMEVAVDDVVPQGAALTCKGHWPKRQAGRANVNVLNPGHKTDMGESSAVHGIEVEVTGV